MSTSLANPRRTKLDAWPSRHHAAGERDQAAAHSDLTVLAGTRQAEQGPVQDTRDADR